MDPCGDQGWTELPAVDDLGDARVCLFERPAVRLGMVPTPCQQIRDKAAQRTP